MREAGAAIAGAVWEDLGSSASSPPQLRIPLRLEVTRVHERNVEITEIRELDGFWFVADCSDV